MEKQAMTKLTHNAGTLTDCCCTRCGVNSLESLKAGAWDNEEILTAGLRCGACGAAYDIVWGTPFLGGYETDDILGLIEIAANAREDNTYAGREEILRVLGLVERFHAAPDREGFVNEEADPFVREPWFANRYDEWLQFTVLSEGIPFAGMKILDVGSGTGFDCYRLVAAGAHVTALDYNPMLIKRGKLVIPEARWIGGFSHALPFASQTFDIVCANAALHHMRDVSVALEEMLRVLKPGGHLITTGDSYRPRMQGPNVEFEVFDRHESVLLGVNESIPSFVAFENVLDKYRDSLDIRLCTHWLRGAANRGIEDGVKEIRWWNYDRDREMLGNASGSLGLRCRLIKPVEIAPHLQSDTVLTAGAYSACLKDYSAAIHKLAPIVPPDLVNRPFPGRTQAKLELLNGWQAPKPWRARSGYKRARWFLRRGGLDGNRAHWFSRRGGSGGDFLQFSARRMKKLPGSTARMDVLINGKVVASEVLNAYTWHKYRIPLSDIRDGDLFICELQLSLDPVPKEARFDDYVFQVRGRRLASSGKLSSAKHVQRARFDAKRPRS